MPGILLRNDRIKRLDISDGVNVIGQAVFNPFDMAIYKKYTGMRMRLAKDKQEYEKLAAEYNELPKNISEDTLLDSGDYERLNDIYQAEQKLSGGIDNIFANLRSGVDDIFGEGVYDMVTQGYQDEGMLEPLFEAAKPFFDEAAAERGERVEQAKLNREARRSGK